MLLPNKAVALVLAHGDESGISTSAPGGTYENSGWQSLGYFGSFMGTAISPQHFITAQHFGLQGTTFVQPDSISGSGTLTYNLDTTVNGGLGYWDIPGTDLRVFQIIELFNTYAEIFLGDPTGQNSVLFGRGGLRGDPIYNTDDQLLGYKHAPGDGQIRWGTNQINYTIDTVVGTLLVSDFSRNGTEFEAGLANGDSGGSLFIQDGGVWKLAGIHYAIEGRFDTNNIIGDGTEFSASLFDKGGLYRGSDSIGWTYMEPEATDDPTAFYMSSVTASASAIQAIIAVPEPASLLFVILSTPFLCGRQRKQSPKKNHASTSTFSCQTRNS